MATEDLSPHPVPAVDRRRHEVMAPLIIISARVQLIQRQLQRSQGLTNLERDELLNDVEAVLAAVQR